MKTRKSFFLFGDTRKYAFEFGLYSPPPLKNSSSVSKSIPSPPPPFFASCVSLLFSPPLPRWQLRQSRTRIGRRLSPFFWPSHLSFLLFYFFQVGKFWRANFRKRKSLLADEEFFFFVFFYAKLRMFHEYIRPNSA